MVRLQKSIRYKGVKIWNSIETNLKSMSISKFTTAYKNQLLGILDHVKLTQLLVCLKLCLALIFFSFLIGKISTEPFVRRPP